MRVRFRVTGYLALATDAARVTITLKSRPLAQAGRTTLLHRRVQLDQEV